MTPRAPGYRPPRAFTCPDCSSPVPFEATRRLVSDSGSAEAVAP